MLFFRRNAPLTNSLKASFFTQDCTQCHISLWPFEPCYLTIFISFMSHRSISSKSAELRRGRRLKKMPNMVCKNCVLPQWCSIFANWGGEKKSNPKKFQKRENLSIAVFFEEVFVANAFFVNQHFTEIIKFLSFFWFIFLFKPSFPTAVSFSVRDVAFFPCC